MRAMPMPEMVRNSTSGSITSTAEPVVVRWSMVAC